MSVTEAVIIISPELNKAHIELKNNKHYVSSASHYISPYRKKVIVLEQNSYLRYNLYWCQLYNKYQGQRPSLYT